MLTLVDEYGNPVDEDGNPIEIIPSVINTTDYGQPVLHFDPVDVTGQVDTGTVPVLQPIVGTFPAPAQAGFPWWLVAAAVGLWAMHKSRGHREWE